MQFDIEMSEPVRYNCIMIMTPQTLHIAPAELHAAPSVSIANVRKSGGDNQYLTHIECDILVSGIRAGQARLALYDAGLALTMGTAFAWISPPDSYLHPLRQYLFKPCTAAATLPQWLLSHNSNGRTSKVLILDDVQISDDQPVPPFQLLDHLVDIDIAADVILISDWVGFARKIGLRDVEAAPFFLSTGFYPADGEIMLAQRGRLIRP